MNCESPETVVSRSEELEQFENAFHALFDFVHSELDRLALLVSDGAVDLIRRVHHFVDHVSVHLLPLLFANPDDDVGEDHLVDTPEDSSGLLEAFSGEVRTVRLLLSIQTCLEEAVEEIFSAKERLDLNRLFRESFAQGGINIDAIREGLNLLKFNNLDVVLLLDSLKSVVESGHVRNVLIAIPQDLRGLLKADELVQGFAEWERVAAQVAALEASKIGRAVRCCVRNHKTVGMISKGVWILGFLVALFCTAELFVDSDVLSWKWSLVGMVVGGYWGVVGYLTDRFIRMRAIPDVSSWRVVRWFRGERGTPDPPPPAEEVDESTGTGEADGELPHPENLDWDLD